MGMCLDVYLGVYFEITEKVKEKKHIIKCEKCHQQYFEKLNFCSHCAGNIIEKEKTIGDRYLTPFEVEEKAELEEDSISGVGELEKKFKKYFIYNLNISTIEEIELNNDVLFMDKLPEEKEFVDKALQDKTFNETVKKLEEHFGENFKLKFGIYSTYR